MDEMRPDHRERVVRGKVMSAHLVQLFDELDSLADGVAAFLHDGWKQGTSLLVAAKAANWSATAARLEARGCPVLETIASGRLVVLDAATTLATFMRAGEPDPGLFDDHVGSLVRRLTSECTAGLRVYGEMVEILAEQSHFAAAIQLEDLWNDLGRHCSFTLLCGYCSAHFADSATDDHLKTIRSRHTSASAKPTDLLGSWLLSDRQPRYHTTPQE